MTTVAQAQAAIRSRLEANPITGLALRWPNETAALPGEPAPFAYVELLVDDAAIVGFGGGRHANLHRTTGRIEAQVLIPTGTAVADGLAYGESIATLFRSYRDADLNCFAAEVWPEAGASDDGNYMHVAVVIVELHFDKIG